MREFHFAVNLLFCIPVPVIVDAQYKLFITCTSMSSPGDVNWQLYRYLAGYSYGAGIITEIQLYAVC